MGKILLKRSSGLISVVGTLHQGNQQSSAFVYICVRTNADAAESCGRPKSAVVPENIIKVHKMVLGNRKLKLREIADSLKISEGSVFTILHEVHENDGQIEWIKLRIASSPTIFGGLQESVPQRLLALSWPEKHPPGKEIWLWRRIAAYFESKDESFYKKGIET